MAFSLKQLFSGTSTAAAPTATIGIDFGSAAVKVVELENTEQGPLLRTYGELQLGPYDSKELGQVVTLPAQQRTAAVVDVMRESQATVRHGALAMPLSSSFLTVIPVALGEGEVLDSRIPVEAKKYVPLPLSDVTLDWSELQPVGESKTTTHEVLLAAIENKALADYKSLLSEIGMTGAPAEIESFSLVRATYKGTDTTTAVIDIGAKTAKLYIVREGALERIHRVPAGGEQITRRVSELLGVDFATAENLKRSYTKDTPQAKDLYKAMSSVIASPLHEFNRFIRQYEARLGTSIGRVVCAGGVANSPYFIPYTKEVLACEHIERANPFAQVAYPAFMEDTLTAIGPVFAPALGAALRQFQTE